MLLVCLYFFCRFGLPPPLSLPFSGGVPLQPVCIHAEPSPSGPSTSTSSQSTTQLASMSDPIHLSRLSFYLRSHPDQEFARFILRGLEQGFHIGYSASTVPSRSFSTNHPSSAANRSITSAYVMQEVSAGRMVGPLAVQLRQQVHCSPIGLVPRDITLGNGV